MFRRILWYPVGVGLPTPLNGEGGENPMETFFSFILSVAANVVAHCIDKWLDEQLKAGKH